MMMEGPVPKLFLLQLVLPIILIILNNISPAASRAGFIARSAALVLGIIYLLYSGVWLFPLWWTPYALLLLTVVMMFALPPRPLKGEPAVVRYAEIATYSVLILAIIGFLLLPAWRGQSATEIAIDLEMPLGPGHYLVVSGGSTKAVNTHLETLELTRERDYRGQSFALDIVGINRAGFLSDGIVPADPSAYAIYEAPVLAPCQGSVASVVDGISDMRVPQMDRTHMAGNHAILECDGVYVVLAHFREGSLSVTSGQAISIGDPIGSVGNSGNTATPHLHIHVQDSLSADAPLGAEPLFFTINGRFLVRNTRFAIE